MSLLGVDPGSTGCKAGGFGLDGFCIALAYRECDKPPHDQIKIRIPVKIKACVLLPVSTGSGKLTNI